MSIHAIWARAQRKQLIVQALILAAIALVIWSAVTSAQTNLAALGVTSGFGFLERATGWSYSFSLIPRDIDDTYARTLTIGLTNTVFVGTISIVLATILGFLVGTARDTRNFAISLSANLFVQVFRNIPLILQAVFWYAVLIHMPGPRQALSLWDAFFLSNRGVLVPTLNIPASAAVLIFGGLVIVAVLLVRGGVPFLRALLIWSVCALAMVAIAVVALSAPDTPVISVPALEGLRFVGGLNMSVELVAMIVSIVLYGAAYIAEVVRGGLKEVPKGLIEAGQAVGLRPFHIWWRIKLPVALRSIVPPLGNQWIFIMKATTIGVAIGFSDLFYIVSTSITQSGQTLELIAILMGAFLLINFTLAQFVNWLNARLELRAH